jgi:hypothetical protein
MEGLRPQVQRHVITEKPYKLESIIRSWDGIQLLRGFYRADGKFALEGLCDSARQRQALRKKMDELSEKSPYLEAFARGIDLTRVRELPLAPLLARLRLVMPAHAQFDGLIVDSACHDDKNRLVIRVRVVGPVPTVAIEEALRKQIVTHELWEARVRRVGLKFEVLQQQDRNSTTADALQENTIRDLRIALRDKAIVCKVPDPQKGNNAGPKYFEQAFAESHVALLHDPESSASWYVRAMFYRMKNDMVRANRDLRRMLELESDLASGKRRREDRLRKIERLQGDIRRQMANLEQKNLEAIKGGVPAMTVSGHP